SDKLYRLWQSVAPLVRAGTLKAVFIEVSFPNEQPDKSLFGHLTPRWLMEELGVLGGLAGKNSLKGLPVVITDRKPWGNQEEVIREELERTNPLQLRLVFPQQGQKLEW